MEAVLILIGVTACIAVFALTLTAIIGHFSGQCNKIKRKGNRQPRGNYNRYYVPRDIDEYHTTIKYRRRRY